MTSAASVPPGPDAAPAAQFVARLAEVGPALLAVCVFVWWTAAEGGVDLSRSYPGGVLVFGALFVLMVAQPRQVGAASTLVRTAVLLAAALGLLMLLSTLWADVPADAWDGGNRTLMYAGCFALFALTPFRTWTLAVCVGIWAAGVAGMGAASLLSAATNGDLGWIFDDNRLSQPVGYVNATCAICLMAFWPAVVLASRRELPVAARAVLLGVAFVLVDLAVLAQSRASLVAFPLTAAAAFLLVPGRVRLLLTLLPVALGVALTLGPMLDVFPALDDGVGRAAAEDAFRALVIGFVLVVLAAAVAASVDRRVTVSARTARRADRALAVGAAALVLAASVGALVAVGHPVARASDAWDEFNSGYPDDFEGSHFTGGGFGDYRADYWRVALGQFREQPLLGAGADNFAAAYIKERRFDNEAHFPHSIQVAILSSTGIVGSVIFLALIGCAGASFFRGWRGRDPLAVAVGAAAMLVFTHWLVHGSIDWFLEIPALGAPAFAFLGAAAATGSPRESGRPSSALAYGIAAAAAAAVVVAAPPWLATRRIESATAGWQERPGESIRGLERAATLDPLSDRPYLLAGAIANRTGRPERARSLLLRALERNRLNWYARLELAIAEAALDHRAAALAALDAVEQLNPREPATDQIREWIEAGEPVDVGRIDAVFRERLESRTQQRF